MHDSQAKEIVQAIEHHEAAVALGAPVRDSTGRAAGTEIAYSLVRKWVRDRSKFVEAAGKETRAALSQTKQGWMRRSGTQ